MTVKLPKILTFERKLEVSDALMFAGSWGDIKKSESWSKLELLPRTGRGTKSHFLSDKHDEKPDPNIFEGDKVFLPATKDTLKVSFTLRVLGDLGKPFSCNMPNFQRDLFKKVEAFKDKKTQGINVLAFRYAYNIANGRFLWRNRVCADCITIEVNSNLTESPLIFDARSFSLNDFDKKSDDHNLKALADHIQQGLRGSDDFVYFEVNAFVKLGEKQQVFPSQEMNMGDKKKTYFQLDKQAAIHDVKIGNALRTIDTWYGNEVLVLTGDKKPKTKTVTLENDEILPIAVEPYGAVTQRGSAYRHSVNDLYSLLPKWVGGESVDERDEWFIFANLIRGGLFNGESDKKE